MKELPSTCCSYRFTHEPFTTLKGCNTISGAMAPTSSRSGLFPQSVLAWGFLGISAYIMYSVQGSLSHKKAPTPMGPPYGPGHAVTINPFHRFIDLGGGRICSNTTPRAASSLSHNHPCGEKSRTRRPLIGVRAEGGQH